MNLVSNKEMLIKARKEGTWNHYYIVNPKVKEIMQIMDNVVE